MLFIAFDPQGQGRTIDLKSFNDEYLEWQSKEYKKKMYGNRDQVYQTCNNHNNCDGDHSHDHKQGNDYNNNHVKDNYKDNIRDRDQERHGNNSKGGKR